MFASFCKFYLQRQIDERGWVKLKINKNNLNTFTCMNSNKKSIETLFERPAVGVGLKEKS